MGTVAVYDYDFFQNPYAIPNLECGKMLAYYKKQKEITVLTEKLDAAPYARMMIRRDYQDGRFHQIFTEEGVTYGGLSFTENIYTPLNMEIEMMIPDFYPYYKFPKYFSNEVIMKKVLNAFHLRMSYDGENIYNYNQERIQNLLRGKSGIIIHDNNIGQIKGAYDFLVDLCYPKYMKEDGLVRPLPLGSKFPIKIYTEDEAYEWISLPTMSGVAYLQLEGVQENKVIRILIEDDKTNMRQLLYNVTYNCENEDDFIINYLEKLYMQVLHFRKNRVKVLLINENIKCRTPIINSLIKLLNLYIESSTDMKEISIMNSTTLYHFCSSKNKNRPFYKKNNDMSLEEMREVFQFVQQKNYKVFKLFYESDNIELI